jgi:hypothetical protein
MDYALCDLTCIHSKRGDGYLTASSFSLGVLMCRTSSARSPSLTAFPIKRRCPTRVATPSTCRTVAGRRPSGMSGWPPCRSRLPASRGPGKMRYKHPSNGPCHALQSPYGYAGRWRALGPDKTVVEVQNSRSCRVSAWSHGLLRWGDPSTTIRSRRCTLRPLRPSLGTPPRWRARGPMWTHSAPGSFGEGMRP